MDSRSEVDGSQTVTDDEAEHKLQQLSGRAFEILIDQLRDQHNVFCKLIKEAQTLESKSNSYSTAALQKKLFQGLSTELKMADKNPLDALQQKEAEEYAAIVKLIKETKEEHIKKIKKELALEKGAFASIEQMRAPLMDRAQQFKKDLYQTLQRAAEEYRAYLCQKGEWEKKFPEFLDKFGCVVTIDSCTAPYHLKKDFCYGLTFGHRAREEYKLPKMDPSIKSLEDKTLTELEKMINDVIAECVYYTNDSYDVLNIIKKSFDQLAQEKHQRDSFQLEEEGRFYRQLKSFKLLKTEEDLITAPMKNTDSDLRKLAAEHDTFLLQQISESLKNIQNVASIKSKNTADSLHIIKQEVSVSVNLLAGQSTKCRKEISKRASNMKVNNANTKTHAIAASAALHNVQVFYDDAIRMAKQKEKNEFERYEKQMMGALLEAEAEMQIVKESLESLDRNRQIIVKQLNFAKENYGGSIYRIPKAEFNREYEKYEIQKSAYSAEQKEYNVVRVLPKALKAYGEIVFTTAKLQAEIALTSQILKTVPNLIQSIWTMYNEALQDAGESKDDKFLEYKMKIDDSLTNLNDISEQSSVKLEKLEPDKDSTEKKVQDLNSEFPSNVSLEFQEYIDMTQMQYTDCVKQKDAAKVVISTVKDISKALAKYKEIVLHCKFIKEEVAEARQAVLAANQAALVVKKVYGDAAAMAREGVVQPGLEVIAMKKYAEAQQAMIFAIEKLNKSKQHLREQEKKLNSFKESFAPELQTKPREIFNQVESLLSDAIREQNTADTTFTSVQTLPRQLHEKLLEAKRIENEKQMATQLRQLLLKAILNNLSLWRMGKWGGGILFKYDGMDYRIPHGVLELITTLSTTADYTQWIPKLVKMASDRHAMGRSWKYRLFEIRDDTTTGVLYHAIKEHLKLNENSLISLQNALSKIPHMELSSPPSGRRFLSA